MKVSLLLMKNVFTLLAKSVLVPFGLRAAALATHAAIQEKIFGSATALIISDEEVNDIMKDFGLLIKGVKNEAKEQKGVFLDMLLGTLGDSLLENMLPGKGCFKCWRENN